MKENKQSEDRGGIKRTQNRAFLHWLSNGDAIITLFNYLSRLILKYTKSQSNFSYFLNVSFFVFIFPHFSPELHPLSASLPIYWFKILSTQDVYVLSAYAGSSLLHRSGAALTDQIKLRI